MRRERDRPSYSLGEAKQLVCSREFSIVGRPRRFIQGRYDTADISSFIAGIFRSMHPRDFLKSEELDMKPGTFADIYRGMRFEGEAWYVKFFIDDGGHVVILSANWDGYIH